MNSLLSSAAAALPQIKRGAHTFEWKVVETSVRCWSIALVPWVPMEIVHRSSGARRNFLGRRTAAGGRLRTTPGSSVGEERLRGQKFSAASLGAFSVPKMSGRSGATGGGRYKYNQGSLFR